VRIRTDKTLGEIDTLSTARRLAGLDRENGSINDAKSLQ
jgi:hypothetical protein